MKKSNEEQHDFMLKMVDSYSRVHNDRYWSHLEPILKEIKLQRILEIGCGPGLLLEEIYQRFGGEKIFALDLSEVMLTKAKETLSPLDADVEFIQQHMQQDTTLPESLDLILSSRVLRSFDNLWEVLHSIYKALVPGGKLVLLEWGKASLQSYHNYLDVDVERAVDLHRNFSKYDLEDWDYMLRHIGFTIEVAFQVDEMILCIVANKNSN